jgi:predicted nucleotidyltransferase
VNPIIIIKELKTALLAQFGDNIQDVILFGSQASGYASEDSDYDILILLKDDFDWKFQDRIFDTACDVGLKYLVLFDLHLLSQNERDHTLKGQEPLYINAIEKGIYA